MKRLILLFFIAITLVACKNDTKTEVNLEENRAKSYDQNDGFITMTGEFVFDSKQNAAVFEASNGTIYGVIIDDNMHVLNEKVKPFKTDEYTSVPVTVRVNRIKNTDQNILWDNIIEIKDILKVEAPKENKKDVIKLSN